MPFSRPSLEELKDAAETDLEAFLPGADARLRRSVLNVLARVIAGGEHGLYGFIDWVSRQVFPDSAEAEFLARWASIWGVARVAATWATGTVDFTGTNGTEIPAGTLVQRADGAQYETDALATVAGGAASAAVTALEPGASGNANAGTAVSLVSPIAGVTSQAAVAAGGVAGGADEEGDASLLERLLARIRQPPHGGADFDYVAWAREVAGVTRAWVYPLEQGLGTVVLRFMMDDTYDDGIPLAADVTAVQDHIDALRPVTADFYALAPVAVALDLEISLTPDTAAVRAAVEAEIADLVRREAEPGGTILISHIREAISIAAGETDHVLASPAADVTHTTGQIAVPGTVTWS